MRGVSPIHALLILGKGTAGRLDHREHCEVVDVNVPEDLLAWERRSRQQETLRSEGSTRQKLPSVYILHGRHRVFVVHHDSCDGDLDVLRHVIGLVGWISQANAKPREVSDSSSRSLNQLSGTRGPMICL